MKDNRFIVLVTVHNSVKWIAKCLDSAIHQDYDNFRLLIIDDHSTDGTWDIVNKYDGCIVRNDTNMVHSLINMVTGLKAFFFNPEDIIVCLDGDDWLYDTQVLTHLNKVYQENVWLTYGQYTPLSGKFKNYCRPLSEARRMEEDGTWSTFNLNSRTYRKGNAWVTSHVKTFKKKAWDMIKEDDFKDEDGKWLITCGDLAMMFPIIEMAGDKRIRFVDRVLYVYNDMNPANHTRTMPQESIRIAQYLQNKPSYDVVD
jgi:glycosyltransferase involved in cell wall biosynthesis